MDCLFCKVVNKEIPAEIVYEDDRFLGFRDINPVAPIHFLIIPKRHISSVEHLQISDKELIGELLLVARQIAQEHGISKSGYRLIFNVGQNAGQTIEHLHLHLLGGKTLLWP